MKKFFAGLLVGALLMVGGSALADEAIKNLIGEVIQGQFPVSVDGEQLDTPALVVDGSTFLPVRKFAESVGYAVYFDTEGGVRLESTQDPQRQTGTHDMTGIIAESNEDVEENNRLRKEYADALSAVQQKEYEIANLSKEIETTQRVIDHIKEVLANPDGDYRDKEIITEESLTYQENELAKLQAEKAQLESELAELKAQLEAVEAQQP